MCHDCGSIFFNNYLAGKRPLARMKLQVSAQMSLLGKCLSTFTTLEWALASVHLFMAHLKKEDQIPHKQFMCISII